VQRALLVLIVIAAYVLFGGGPPWTLAVLAALALAALTATARAAPVFPTIARALDLSLMLVVLAMAAQTIPLPAGVRAMLSPHADQVARTVRLTAPDPWAPLTLDAGASALAIVAVALAVTVFWVARAAFAAGGALRSTCRALAIFGALAACAAVVQRAAEPGLVLGVLTPDAIAARPFGAFVNRNHFADWLLMLVPLAAGHVVARARIHTADEREWRGAARAFLRTGGLLTLLPVATMITVLLLTLSRSAVLGLGVAGLTAWWLARPRMDPHDRGWLLVVGAAGVALLVLSGLVDLDAWSVRLESAMQAAAAPDNRLVIWRETLPMTRDFWLAGTGAGTYGLGMLVYQQSQIWVPHLASWAQFNQAHNHYLQVLTEGGLLVAVPVSLALVLLVRRAESALHGDAGETYWIRVGAAAGLAGVAAASAWDIPLVMPANATVAAVLAAVLTYERRVAASPNHVTIE
jgi:O-antigen ligase